jgi:hypothetical protein
MIEGKNKGNILDGLKGAAFGGGTNFTILFVIPTGVGAPATA